MKLPRQILAVLLAGVSMIATAPASSIVPTPLKTQISEAIAVFRGVVVSVASFRDQQDGAIKTASLVTVDDVFKGRFPAVIRLVQDGGTVDGFGQQDGFSSRLRPGEERLFLLDRRADGYLAPANGFASAILLPSGDVAATELLSKVRTLSSKYGGGADVTDQAAEWSGSIPAPPVTATDTSGLLVDGTFGIPSRFIQPDRGEVIEYLVDAQTLPAGLTLDQCLGAATNAFAAWSAVTGIKFQFAGLQNFGMASANVNATDQRIRVQFHDLYNYITSGETLGRGGRSYTYLPIFQNGGEGGKVVDQEFYPTASGFVVLNHRSAIMQTLSTFEEVLCHEIGHSLGMAHSSENPNETNPVLREAIMYYTAHADGRGATLGAYDPPVIQKVHPPGNTPPYGYDRVMDIVTASPQPNVPGINSVQIKGYDLQNAPLTLSLSNDSLLNGSFSAQGNLVTYTADFPFDEPRVDPSQASDYDSVFARLSDGVNASPYIRIRVLSYNLDTHPATSDGIPDNWAQQSFGSAIPSAANLTRATDDKDGDGLTNLQEWMAGTDPTLSGSSLRFGSFNGDTLQFSARPYDLYEIEGSTDLIHWSRVGNPVLPTTTTGSVGSLRQTTGIRFFRVVHVP